MVTKTSIKSFIFLALLLTISNELSAQKVKYKDLFVLLSANDFKQGEPFLRTFVTDDPEHANANMYMGRLFEYKSHQMDVLKETPAFLSYCDSALIYYRKAYNLIDEKEIKKNDEYYQDYSRRDLRTGKFGVKLADVQFDLEKRISDIEKLSNNVKLLKEHFDNAVSGYGDAESTYLDLVSRFNNMTELLMRSSDSDIDSLDKISKLYEKFTGDFHNYRETLNSVSSSYNQKLTKKFIEGLVKLESPDFYSDQVVVYDFKSWSDKTSKDIVDVIKPMKNNMSEYDRQLDELFRKVVEDSMAVENELANLTEKMLFEQLRNYDSDPLPSLIFNFKVDEISYYSYFNQLRNDGSLDSANIDFQIKIYNNLIEKIRWMQKAYFDLSKVDVEQKADLYSDFVTDRFGNVSNLVDYITQKGERITEEDSFLKRNIIDLNQRSQWGKYQNDSIPLFLSDTIRLVPSDSIFIYKTIAVDSISDGFIAYGIKYNDGKPKNYISKINQEREVDTIFFQTFKTKVQIDSTSTLKSWSVPYSNEKGFIFVTRIASITNTGEIVSGFEITNFEPATGIKWSTAFENIGTVKELNVDVDTGLIVIKMGQITESGPGEETENLVFNFKGSLMTSLGN